MSSYGEAARAALHAGLSPFPPKEDGSKKPDTRRWLEYTNPDEEGRFARLTDDDLKRSYANGRTGVGIFTGLASGGVELFEFDDRPTYERFVDVAGAAGLGDLVTRIRNGYEETTPNDGIHWFYRCEIVAGNTKLASRPAPTPGNRHGVKTLIETRGNGGYAVTAPSSGMVHPSGRSYVQVSGGFATIATITPDERMALWQLARSFDEMPVREQRASKQERTTVQGERPGDDFNARATWGEVLSDWTFVFERNGTRYLRRPGKDDGISATINHTKRDTLIVFSTSTPFETAPTSYSKFAAYTLLEHNGDYRAAASALAGKGYGSKQAGVTFGVGEGQCDEWRRLAEHQRRYIQLYARIRKNKALKHLRNTIIALAGEAQTAAEMGQIDAEGWFPIAVGAVLAEMAGCSRKTAGVHLDRLVEWGVIEKDVWLYDHVEADTGLITPSKRKRTVVRLPGTALDFLDTMSTFEPPERPPQPHRCCSHACRHSVNDPIDLNPLRSFDPVLDAAPEEQQVMVMQQDDPIDTPYLISTRRMGRNYAMGSKRSAGWGNVRDGAPAGSEACAACGRLTNGHVLCSGCDPGGYSATGPRVIFGGGR